MLMRDRHFAAKAAPTDANERPHFAAKAAPTDINKKP